MIEILETPKEEQIGKQTLKEKLKALINELPVYNRDLLEALLRMLWCIGSNSHFNQMDFTNLSFAIGPCILWTDDKSSGVLNEAKSSNKAVKMMISEHEYLFKESIEKEEEESPVIIFFFFFLNATN